MVSVSRSLAAAILVLCCTAASADDYPSRLIRILLGGGPDAAARLIAEKLQAAWGQAVIVENRPAAGGTLMQQEVANAPGDGHTLMFCSSGQIMVVPFYKVSFDMVRDFTAVTQITTMPWVLAVTPSLPVHSVTELVALAKEKPGALNFASSGLGTPPHLVGEMFKVETGVDMVHVPYKTVNQATADVVGGHVQVMFIVATAAMPLIASNSVRALAVTTEQRSPFLPDLPTMIEAGVPGFVADAWNGFCAPAGMPAATLAKLNGEITRIIRMPDIAKKLGDLGNTIVGSSPDAFAAFVKAEQIKWGKYAVAAGAKPE
jgi:tripartite-type tricarboxylate transporter receptor subunit TctC